MKKLSVLGIIGGAALLTAAPFSLHRSQNTVALSLDSADARIGRPRTALSVAGVQRRGYRRAYRGAVYGGVAGYGAGSYYSGNSSPAYSAPYYELGLWIRWLRLSELLRTVLRVWLWVVLRRLWILHRTPLQPGDFSASGVALLGAPGRPALGVGDPGDLCLIHAERLDNPVTCLGRLAVSAFGFELAELITGSAIGPLLHEQQLCRWG